MAEQTENSITPPSSRRGKRTALSTAIADTPSPKKTKASTELELRTQMPPFAPPAGQQTKEEAQSPIKDNKAGGEGHGGAPPEASKEFWAVMNGMQKVLELLVAGQKATAPDLEKQVSPAGGGTASEKAEAARAKLTKQAVGRKLTNGGRKTHLWVKFIQWMARSHERLGSHELGTFCLFTEQHEFKIDEVSKVKQFTATNGAAEGGSVAIITDEDANERMAKAMKTVSDNILATTAGVEAAMRNRASPAEGDEEEALEFCIHHRTQETADILQCSVGEVTSRNAEDGLVQTLKLLLRQPYRGHRLTEYTTWFLEHAKEHGLTAPQMVLLDRCLRSETESDVKLVLTRSNLENYVAMAALTARVKRASPEATVTAPDKRNETMSPDKTAKPVKRNGHSTDRATGQGRQPTADVVARIRSHPNCATAKVIALGGNDKDGNPIEAVSGFCSNCFQDLKCRRKESGGCRMESCPACPGEKHPGLKCAKFKAEAK